MKWYGLCLGAALALAGCSGSDAPQPAPSQSINPEAPLEMPVAGEEKRIFALGDSLFAGYGLTPPESYPMRLEAALRARGINARMINAGVSGDTSADGAGRLAVVGLPHARQEAVLRRHVLSPALTMGTSGVHRRAEESVALMA